MDPSGSNDRQHSFALLWGGRTDDPDSVMFAFKGCYLNHSPAIKFLLCLGCGLTFAHAQVFVSPHNYTSAEADGRLNSAPFNNVCRYQQIYAASEFGPIAGPRLITQIAFRPDTTQPSPFTHTFTNIQVNLSTTTRAVNGLSSTFASNVGANDTMVFLSLIHI